MCSELFVPVTQDEIDALNTEGGATIPSLLPDGDTSTNHVPDGWKLVDDLFVDSSGYGGPALSVDQMKSEMVLDRGYAINDIGQFQLHVGVYRRVS